MAPENRKLEIKPIKKKKSPIREDFNTVKKRLAINRRFLEQRRAVENKLLIDKRKQFVAEYSKKRIDELGILSESVAKNIQELSSGLKQGKTGFLFGEKKPQMERELKILRIKLDAILSVRQQKLRTAQIIHGKKHDVIRKTPSAEPEVREGMNTETQRVVPGRDGNVRATGTGGKTSGQIRIIDRKGDTIKPAGEPSGWKPRDREPVRQLPSGKRKRPSREEPTLEPKKPDFMQQEVVPKPGESRRGVQGELDLRVEPRKGNEKTPEQERAERIFIKFIRDNSNFEFKTYQEFFNWVNEHHTIFNVEQNNSTQIHQTIIQIINSRTSIADIRTLIQTQQQVINILKGVRGRELTEEDLKKINELILRAENNIVGKLKLTRDDLIRAIEAQAEKAQLRDFGLKTKLAELERKVDKMSESLDEILREVLARKGLTADEKKAFVEEFTLLRSLIFGATKNLQNLSARNMTILLNVLTRIEARIPNTVEFNQILELSLTKIIATNNQTLITQFFSASQMKKWNGRYTQILERFAEVRNLIRKLGVKVKDIPEMIEKLKQLLSLFTSFKAETNLTFQKITEAIEALKPLTEEQIKTILEKVIEKADLPKKVLEKMQDYFKNNPEFGEVIRDALEAKFTAIENKMDTIRDELKNAIENSGLTKVEKEVLFDQLNHLIAEIAETKTLSAESRDMLLKLKEKFPDDKTLEEIMKPIIEATILENNERIQQMLVDMGLAKSSEISSFEERLAALEEKIDEKGDKGDKGEDGKGGKGGSGETEAENKKNKDETPGFFKRAFGFLSTNLGGTMLLLLIAGIVYAAITAAQKAPAKITQSYSITPMFGETVKTAATTSSSILGSLGGINPLIIIGIVAVLFLLFPKK